MFTHKLFVEFVSWISIFGMCLTVVFLLILYATRKERKIEYYTYSIAQNCIFDLLFTICTLAFKMDQVLYEGYHVFGVTAFNYRIPDFFVRAIIMSILGTSILSLLGTYIPFALRYWIICKNNSVKISTLIYFYIPVVLCVIINVVGLDLCFTSSVSELDSLQMRPYLLPHSEGRFWNFVAVKITDVRTMALYSFLFITVSICFTATIYLNVKVFRALNNNPFTDSERISYFELQKTMAVQSFVQLLFMVIPSFGTCIGSLLGFKGVNYAVGLIEISPVAMTTCTILSVKKYREQIINFFHNIIFLCNYAFDSYY